MTGRIERLTRRGRLALWAARAAAWASQRAGRGKGSMIGGLIALKVDPTIMAQLARDRRAVVITGTNGKSTTTRMTAAALATLGDVATQADGANMDAGIVAALVANPDAEIAAIEVDELHVPHVSDALDPQVIVLLNLSRDQLDRVGEINAIERRLRAGLARHPDAVVIANCDDVLMTSAAYDARNVVWVAAGSGWAGDATSCPRSGEPILWDGASEATGNASGASAATGNAPGASEATGNASGASAATGNAPGASEATGNAHGPHWRSTGTDFARPTPAWWVDDEVLHGPDGLELPMKLAVPGRANRGNAAQAVAAAVALGVGPTDAVAAVSTVNEVAGRYRTVQVGSHSVRMLLAKNPAGWQEALSMIDPTVDGLVIAVNGQVPDGEDLSWLWDVRFEHFEGVQVVAAGERGTDLAVRLTYAGVEHTLIKDPVRAIASCPPGRVEVLANYTAFRDLNRELDRG